jgi:hypothetical protein
MQLPTITALCRFAFVAPSLSLCLCRFPFVASLQTEPGTSDNGFATKDQRQRTSDKGTSDKGSSDKGSATKVWRPRFTGKDFFSGRRIRVLTGNPAGPMECRDCSDPMRRLARNLNPQTLNLKLETRL